MHGSVELGFIILDTKVDTYYKYTAAAAAAGQNMQERDSSFSQGANSIVYPTIYDVKSIPQPLTFTHAGC